MRVLLPLRKVSANKQSSSSSLSDLEEEAGSESLAATLPEAEQSVDGRVAVLAEPVAEATDHDFDSNEGTLHPRQQEPGLHEGGLSNSEVGTWKTTDLKASSGPSIGEFNRKESILHRKRRALLDSGDLRLTKRPAIDKKPPPKDLNTMVAGGRRPNWFYRNDGNDIDSSPEIIAREPLENDPASARGDVLSEDQDMDFYLALKKRGLEIREQEGDGNCLFRAVSLQVYGDPSMHGEVRKQCMDFMERDQEHFSQFVTGEPFSQYIQRKRQDGVHGNNPEIQAISELFNRPVEVFCPDNGATPLNIFHAEYKTDDAPIRLSYHDGNHYNAVVDPLVPTAGLGLGMPGLQPGLADKMQVAQAVVESDAAADQMELKRALKESEDDELQRAIKESKLSAEHMYSNEALALSDMDATYFELEQAALERSLESYSNLDQGQKRKASISRRRKQGISSSSPLSTPSAPDSACDQSPQSAVASLPADNPSPSQEACIPAVAAAATASSVASVASAAASAKSDDSVPLRIGDVDEYPQTVQELAMNGFELRKVVRAYELIGDNFDDLLAFLMSNTA